MGNNFSSLNCSRNKKRKKKKKKLSEDVDKQKDSLDGLHSKAGKLLPKISPKDQSLVEDSLRSTDKRHGELQSRIERTKKQYDAVFGNLSDIKAEVDKYLLWLTQQEKAMSEEVAPGTHNENTETRLQKIKGLCDELQSKQATIEVVKGKVEELQRDLPQSEREVVDQWVTEVCDQHHKVYHLAGDQRKLLASSVEQRDVFHHKLQQVYHWLQGKEKEANKLQSSASLASQDVEKQVERCRALQNELTLYKPQIEELQKRGKMLHVDCTPEEKTEIDKKVADVDIRYSTLGNDLSTCHNFLRDGVTIRKNFETDQHKIDKWCKETEMRCATEPNLDSAVEVLEEQLTYYMNLEKQSKMFESLVKVTEETGSSIKGHLPEDEKLKLEQQSHTASEKFQKCAELIMSRQQCLKEALTTRAETQESISKAADWMDNIEKEFKKLPKASGFDVVDGEKILKQCEAIGETLSVYQPTITQLNQESERLRSSGKSSDADSILNITTKYEILQDQVAQQRKKYHKGVTLGQQYETQKKNLKTFLSEAKAELEQLDSQDLPQRIKSLEALAEKLVATDSELIQLENKVRQLIIENPGEDVSSLRKEHQQVVEEADLLKKAVQKKLKHCKAVQKSCEEFEFLTEEATSWLEQKEEALANCGPLDLDTAMINSAIHKHQNIVKEANEKLTRLKEKAQTETAHYDKLGEPVPERIVEKLEQIDSLENTLTSAIAKKEEYLIAAQADRVQFDNSMKQINDWLSGAETLTDSGYDTLDFENLNDTLTEHQDYFHEASMCQDEMEQVQELSERLLPTLDSNDTETLRQTLKHTNQRLNTVMAKSNRKQEMLEQKSKEWKEFQEAVMALNDQFGTLEEEFTKSENIPISNQSAVKDQIAATKDLSEKLEKVHPEVNDLHDKAHELERVANLSCCSAISKLSTDCNQRWQELASAAEGKQMALCNISENWEDFTNLASNLDKMLLEVDEGVPEVDVENCSALELSNQLRNTKDLTCRLEASEPKILALKRCAQSLEQSLPTAEGKVQIQEKLFDVMEKVERIQGKAQETQAVLEEEVEDRENFNKELTDTLSWLSETKNAVTTLDSGKHLSDVTEKVQEQKVLQQEFATKMKQLEQGMQRQEKKYASMSKTLPSEMVQQLQDVQELQTSVMDVMQNKEQELLLIQSDRQEVTSALKEVESWLNKIEPQTQEQIIDIADSKQKHQQLSQEFETFKPVLDHLREKGSDLIKHSSNPIEKQTVQKSLRDINQQWLNLQAKFAKRGGELNEAEKLSRDFQNTAHSVQEWLNSAKNITGASEDSGIKERMKSYLKLSKESDQNQNKVDYLGSVLRQMDPICDTSRERDKLARINQQMFKIHTDVKDKLGVLEDSVGHLEECERDLRDLRRWMEETRSHLPVRNSSTSLREQLAQQERMLADIEIHREKAQEVLEQSSGVLASSGDLSKHPDLSILAEIDDLQQEASDRCRRLRDAVNQQEQFEMEVQSLTADIYEAQDKLLSSPVQGTDMGSLKKQISEHNALAAQIKQYQDRIHNINEKSKRLMAKSEPDFPSRLPDSDLLSFSSSMRIPISDSDHPDSGVFLTPRSLTTTTTPSFPDDLHRQTGKAWKSSPLLFPPGQHSPLSTRRMAERSSDTIHGIGSAEVFDGSKVERDPPRLSQENFSNLLSKQTAPGLNRSVPSVQKVRSRSPSPTALCDDELIQPKKYSAPQMLSLSPRQFKRQKREKPTARQPIKAALKALDPVTGVSTSVPNLLAAHLELPRERSASFDSKARPLLVGHSPGARDSKLAELNSSWNTLQMQLGTKEQQLLSALQNQKQFQEAVKDVNAQIDRLQFNICGEMGITSDVDKHIADFQQILHGIDEVKGDIIHLREQGRHLVDPSDKDGLQTMQSTLTILSDRVENLQALADIKGNQLQEFVKDKERHAIAKSAYQKQLGDIEEWIAEKEMEMSETPLATEKAESLRKNLEADKALQEDVSKRLQAVRELAVQCDQLCQYENPQNAKKLRSHLSNVQKKLGALKLAAIEKQGHLRHAVKESEKRQREMNDYEDSLQKLQAWVTETRHMTLPSQSMESLISPDHAELQEKLKSDISDHRQLLHHISKEVPNLRPSFPEGSGNREAKLDQRWEKIHREFAHKRQNLEDMLDKKDLDFPDSSMPTVGWNPPQHRGHQLGDVRKKLSDLLGFWHQLQHQCEDKQLRLDNALSFQQNYQDALQDVSSWLDLAEQRLFNPDTDYDLDEMLKDSEAIQHEIRSLQSDISAMGNLSQGLLSAANRESQGLIQQSLENLDRRVQMIENKAQSKADELTDSYSLMKEHKEDLKNLQEKMSELSKEISRFKVLFPADQHVSAMQKLEAKLASLESKFEDFKKREDSLSSPTSVRIPPSDWQSLNNQLTEIKQMVTERKADILQSVSAQEQYEKMLKDYAEFLETAKEKVKLETLSVTSLEELKKQIASHQDFFSDLEVHRAMLDSLAAQTNQAVRQKHLSKHSQLNNQTHVLLDKASLIGQKLERTARQWTNIYQSYVKLQQFLDRIENQIPKSASKKETSPLIQERIALYKQLQKDLNEERPILFQFVDKAKQLLHSVNCAPLEKDTSDLADRYINLNSEVSNELKRLESIGQQMEQFSSEAADLASWMTKAQAKISGIRKLSDKDQESIGVVRGKVDKLLEFKKEMQQKQPQLTKVIENGNQLAQSSTGNSAETKGQIGLIAKQWANLNQSVAETEKELHQMQMNLMPSRQALNELTTWLDIMEIAVKGEKEKSIKNFADVGARLKKFKDFNVELGSKQLTVDFVNQSAMQTSAIELLAPGSSDQIDFAERLGQANKRWQSLEQSIKQTLKNTETMHNKWQEFDRALGRISKWFGEQEEKITRYHLTGHEISVKQTLADCKILQDALSSKEDEIDNVKKMGDELIDLSYSSLDCQETVQSSLDNLIDQRQQISSKVRELQNVLNDFLRDWNAYNSELNEVNKVLLEADYTLKRYTKVGADLKTHEMQVEKLQNLSETVQRCQPVFERLLMAANQLTGVCESQAKREIQQTQLEIQTSWDSMCKDLRRRLDLFEDSLAKWKMYEEEYAQARLWLETKERLSWDLLAKKEDSSKRQECFETAKTLMRDLDDFQSRVFLLYQLGDAVTKNMDSTSIVTFTSRQSAIEQRLMALRQTVSKLVEELRDEISQKQEFYDLLNKVKMCLSDVDRVLEKEEMNQSSDDQAMRNQFEELKNALTQMDRTAEQLDVLNGIGYRRTLTKPMAKELRDLNNSWHKKHSQLRERAKSLQGLLLIQNDFKTKCDMWMTFLGQTELDLSIEIAGNLPDLQRQLRQCEKFELDMYTKQQILHSIIHDGQKITQERKLGQNDELQLKLHLLAEQWESVRRRAIQRKAIISNSIHQWNTFNDSVTALHNWLKEKETILSDFDADSVTIHESKNILEKLQGLQRDLKSQEAAFKRIHVQGKPLMQHSDEKGQEEVHAKIDMLQTLCMGLVNSIERKCTRLERVLHEWQDCEKKLEELLLWLKDIRTAFSRELPSGYDQLQAEYQKCVDIEASFQMAEIQRQSLLEMEIRLSSIIHSEDLNILHQRILLLNKQWDELQNQASQRKMQIQSSICHWASFSDKVSSFHKWIDNMEYKVITNKEYHIEDLLHKFSKEYKVEMLAKEQYKDKLLEEGQELLKISSELQRPGIESQIQKTEDKWNHLKKTLKFRKRKLEETLLAVRQLDTSMANLRKWLANIEHDLCSPLFFMESDDREMKEKLQCQKELQKDVELHSAGVGSVLNLCEVLLHDSDACPTEIEFSALQTAMKNLDRRWRHICQSCPERRLWIEDTWNTWEKLRADCDYFESWLNDVEQEIEASTSDDLNVSFSKEEIEHFEQLQREIHGKFNELEQLNKVYRKLAREGRTDHAGSLKSVIHHCNTEWDRLQQKVSAITTSLKQSATVSEDFRNKKDQMYKWLTDVEVRITDLEHLSPMNIPAKMAEVKRLKSEIDIKESNMVHIDSLALHLIKKGDMRDASQTQKEAEDLKNYLRAVKDRIYQFSRKLESSKAQLESVHPGPHSTDELDMLELQLKSDVPYSTALLSDTMHDIEEYLDASPPESPPEKRRVSPQGILHMKPSQTSRPTTPRSRSRTPVDLLPSKRSRSPFSGASPRASPSGKLSKSPIASREEILRKFTQDAPANLNSKLEALMGQMVDALDLAKQQLRQLESEVHITSPRVPDLGRDYMPLVSECEQRINEVKTLDRVIKSETGFSNISSIDREVEDVKDRWEVLQAIVFEKDQKLAQHKREWRQFMSDIDNMQIWLDEVNAKQNQLRSFQGGITNLDFIVKHHRDFLMQLESKKARVQSLNLLGRDFIDLTTKEGKSTHDKLKKINYQWDKLCSKVIVIQRELQEALMRCQEFHHTIHDLLLWLESIENKLQQCEPINLSLDETAMWAKLRKLTVLKADLESNKDRIFSLKETADKLLINSDSVEMINTHDKMHIIANRHNALMKLCSSYTSSLEDVLKVPKPSIRSLPLATPSNLQQHGDRNNSRTPTERYLNRTLMVAVPLQCLFLFMLGLASLVPVCEDDYSCDLINNFGRSLGPLLRYLDGPPPV